MSEDYTPIKKEMTVRMIKQYCSDHHGGRGLCPQCIEWRDRAFLHLDRCRHKDGGWPCNTCPDRCFTGEDGRMMDLVQGHMVQWMSAHPEEAAAMMPSSGPR